MYYYNINMILQLLFFSFLFSPPLIRCIYSNNHVSIHYKAYYIGSMIIYTTRSSNLRYHTSSYFPYLKNTPPSPGRRQQLFQKNDDGFQYYYYRRQQNCSLRNRNGIILFYEYNVCISLSYFYYEQYCYLVFFKENKRYKTRS